MYLVYLPNYIARLFMNPNWSERLRISQVDNYYGLLMERPSKMHVD